MILIREDNEAKITANFSEAEIFRASYGVEGQSFFMDEKVLTGGQIIRDYFNHPSSVNSSKRTKQHELLMGRSGRSQHTLGRAMDYDYPTEILLKYHKEILNQGVLYDKLIDAGIRGFGLYDGFIHIDSRPTEGVAFWDVRVTTKKKG